MEPDFWHQRWQTNQVGFHLDRANDRLVAHWATASAGATPGARVLVPLCGKSLDLRWLRNQGHRVIGIELSPIACETFFAEQGFAVERREERQGVVRWRGLGDGPGGGDGIEILQADLFVVSDEDIGAVDLLYDRASAIALPPSTRERLFKRLADWLPAGARGLLITMDYPEAEKQGPPFSVPSEAVEALCAGRFATSLLSRDDLIARDGVSRWQLTRVHELSFALRRLD